MRDRPPMFRFSLDVRIVFFVAEEILSNTVSQQISYYVIGRPNLPLIFYQLLLFDWKIFLYWDRRNPFEVYI